MDNPNKNELSDQELRMFCVEQAAKARTDATKYLEYDSLAQEASWVYSFIKGCGDFNPECYYDHTNKDNK